MTATFRRACCGIALGLGLMSGAWAQGKVVSGSYNSMFWSASSRLTGVTNTGDSALPLGTAGDPIYHPVYPRDSGIVHLLMDFGGPDNQFICSGTLLADRVSVLTAGHCVSSGFATATPVSTTVFFQPVGGVPAGTRIQSGGLPNAGAETRAASQYFINSGYTGEVIDHNDVAVIRLSSLAPDWANSYGLYTNSSLTGADFSVAGYGRLGDGATGSNNFAARLRSGDNRYDFALGNAAFGQNWATVLGSPFSRIQHSWVSDFDNGLAANDTACLTALDPTLAGAAGAVFCNLGRGAREVNIAGGDSGGPNFIDGMISGVNSYGLTFGTAYGDSLCLTDETCLNDSFGEFSGFVPTYLHQGWIQSVMVPEPGAYTLMGLGLAAVAGWARRRRG